MNRISQCLALFLLFGLGNHLLAETDEDFRLATFSADIKSML